MYQSNSPAAERFRKTLIATAKGSKRGPGYESGAGQGGFEFPALC